MLNQLLKGLFLVVIFLFILANAKADVMNLNDYMPTRMEDARVTELHKVEFQGSTHWDGEQEIILFRPNIRWGAYKRLHIEYFSNHLSGSSSSKQGSGDTGLGFQWNFHDQDDWVPSFAFAPQVTFPTGKKSEGIDPSARLNMTYTLVGTLIDPVGQFHLNYDWKHNSSKKPHENKVGKTLIFGYNHRILLKNSVLIDLVHEKNIFSQSTRNILELGWLREFEHSLLLGLGVGMDLKSGHFSSTLAIQKSF